MIGFVTDRRRGADPSTGFLMDRIRTAIAAGVDWVQIRERDLADRDLAALVRVATDLAGGTTTRILVNDRMDIAAAAAAHGVHLRADSADPARVRAIAPEGFLVGRSVHTADEAAAVRDCDFLLFGTLFPSAGKAPGHPIAGLDALRRACTLTSTPVLAIGGIDERNAHEAARAGARGVAAVGLFMTERSVGDLAAALRAMRSAFTR